LLCLDPGETTGWATFQDGELLGCGQAQLDHADLFQFIDAALSGGPDDKTILCENYRVYAHRSQQHIGSEVVTIQYMGVVKLYARLHHVPLVLQMAWQAKGFQTDAKLREWGLYQVAMKHANDAVRHGCYYYLFHKGS
jgi:hypothetical protein